MFLPPVHVSTPAFGSPPGLHRLHSPLAACTLPSPDRSPAHSRSLGRPPARAQAGTPALPLARRRGRRCRLWPLHGARQGRGEPRCRRTPRRRQSRGTAPRRGRSRGEGVRMRLPQRGPAGARLPARPPARSSGADTVPPARPPVRIQLPARLSAASSGADAVPPGEAGPRGRGSRRGRPWQAATQTRFPGRGRPRRAVART
jgi:hypothetical protein